MLTEEQAYDAMEEFLDAYWRRGGCTSSDIALLLTVMHRSDPGITGDPAQWDDWLAAIKKVKARSGLPS